MPKNERMNTPHPDSYIIDALGGTSKTARLCRVQPASVSEWRKTGIPDARRMFLQLARPDVFDQDREQSLRPESEPH